MIYWQLFISCNTLFAYWLLTHPMHDVRRIGLWVTLVSEIQWTTMLSMLALWGLVPISIIMFIITVKRLLE